MGFDGEIKFIAPVYLNQQLVFDFLSMADDGISSVQSVTRKEILEDNTASSMSGKFGLNSALSSLLKVDVGAQLSDEHSKGSEKIVNEEKIQTPASLFWKLRKRLYQLEQVDDGRNLRDLRSGDLIEFSGILVRNPFVETLSSLLEFMEMYKIFSEEEVSYKNKKNKIDPLEKQIQQIRSVLERFHSGNTLDLVAEIENSEYQAVITVDTSYLNDPDMSDILDGNFKVLAKITRNIISGEDGVNLLRKTAFSKFPTELIDQVFGAMAAEIKNAGLRFPALETSIKAPVLSVIPIAIYS